MLEAGEDPEFIARRMVIFASEDVGLADPTALVTAVAAFEALQFVGLPEAAYHLTHATMAMATAPKSSTVKQAMGAARSLVADGPTTQVPPHLRSAATEGERAMGFGVGYVSPHTDPLGVIRQQYLPDGLEDVVLFTPGSHGVEGDIASRLEKIDRILGKPERPGAEG